METQNAAWWIEQLQLIPHPEGGYYKETFRSKKEVSRVSSADIKQACTSIYYLVEGHDYSGFHKIASDEIMYFHKGMPFYIHVINRDGIHETRELSDTATGSLSVAIEAGLWFAAEIPAQTGFSLISCAVAPGFVFNEFEMAEKQKLTALYPQYAELFARLCRS